MNSRIVSEAMRRRGQHAIERATGAPPTQMRMASARTAEAQVLNIYRLPAVANGQQLQDASGNMVYLPGYSDPAGPDVGHP